MNKQSFLKVVLSLTCILTMCFPSFILAKETQLYGRQPLNRQAQSPKMNSSQCRSRANYPATYRAETTSVKNQDIYETCWSFGLIAAGEGNAIKNEITSPDYSEKHLAYFFYNRKIDPLNLSAGDLNIASNKSAYGLYNGGHPYTAAISLSQWTGYTNESKAKYGTSTALNASLNYQADRILKNAYFLDNNKDAIKSYIMSCGSIVMSYQHYNNYFNEQTNAYYYPNKDDGNHTIAVVGWDDHFSKDNFNAQSQPQNDGAWIVKNSWGEEWGDNGYFYISYEDQSLCDFTAVETTSSTTYDNNYYYDGSSSYGAGYPLEKGDQAIQYFTSLISKETLKAIQLTTLSPNALYKIMIYKNPKNIKRLNAETPVVTQTFSALYEGIYTVDLDKSISLTKGSKFAIVIESLSSDNVLAVDTNIDYGWIRFINKTYANQSFVKSEGITYDLNNEDEPSCFRIKALTTGKASIGECTFSSISKKTYTGKYQKPSITVKFNGKTLTNGVDYTLSYSSYLYPGRAKITVKGKGRYTGTTYRYFYILPKKVSISSAKSTSRRSITIKYKKVTKPTGYQIAYRKKGSSTWKYRYVSSKYASKKLTGLSRRKYYYVKVRAYKTVSGKKYFGSFSTTKKVKVK